MSRSRAGRRATATPATARDAERRRRRRGRRGGRRNRRGRDGEELMPANGDDGSPIAQEPPALCRSAGRARRAEPDIAEATYAPRIEPSADIAIPPARCGEPVPATAVMAEPPRLRPRRPHRAAARQPAAARGAAPALDCARARSAVRQRAVSAPQPAIEPPPSPEPVDDRLGARTRPMTPASHAAPAGGRARLMGEGKG